MDKNILIIGLNSEIAQNVINELKKNNWNIYATSRQVSLMEDRVHEYRLDVTKEEDFIHLKECFNNIEFDVVLNFTGIAIASPVEELQEIELKKQFDVNLFGLLRIIKYFAPNLKTDGRLINVSSMASYGIFPFISPYCMSKASADILLNTYAVESGKRVVSIRPGAVATKFWDASIENNKACFENNKEKFAKEKEFLAQNAQKNSLKALNPIYVAKKIANIVELKKPSLVYNIGLDAKFVKLSRFLPQGLMNKIVKFGLKTRLKRTQNG